jgi:serine/threonine protein kinase
LENLAYLTHLKHANIVQLYCAYAYRHEYNLIFALADGGSLKDLLNGTQGIKGPEGSQLLLALAELASAIDEMHNFTSKELDLSLSGCHHDLAPRNILVHGKTFLLADFGLSTFHNTEEDSLTTFKGINGSYAAPESHTFHDGHTQVRRASDIWSFGCILAEVFTYMVEGSAGVQNFRDQRISQYTPDTTWTRFYRGPKTPSPEVAQWLNHLQANGEPYRVQMVSLIQKMLSMDPNERPRSAQVVNALRGISILAIASPVSLTLDRAHNANPGIDLMLGKIRFQAWLFAFKKLLDTIDRTELIHSDFTLTAQALTFSSLGSSRLSLFL